MERRTPKIWSALRALLEQKSDKELRAEIDKANEILPKTDEDDPTITELMAYTRKFSQEILDKRDGKGGGSKEGNGGFRWP